MRRFIAVIIPFVVALAGPRKAAEVTSFSLENGMDVVVLEDHRAPAVVHMVWYRVGSADEPRGVSGIAHYLEHLMFKATDELEVGRVFRDSCARTAAATTPSRPTIIPAISSASPRTDLS